MITAAGANAYNVVGLVYIFACAPYNGEALGELDERMPVASGQADIRPGAEGFLWIDPKDFPEAFGQDVDPVQAGVDVTVVLYLGTIHDFVMLNALADTPATRSAIVLAIGNLRTFFASSR
ncbi:hypothetical protein RG963_15150 [Methanosarcina sp. Z-7115]|uniref:Uncharacterized protein n=1 Tax=Methanosarcina baikalica TaxID=3073890 RepID=A0ABU2D548_9EURY|nr:hypothetical protein [Methanosarcina sp. Z-7115]MDR7667088.1 hypothetical protein [Methanosarcina sp. Z-7115]